MRSGMAKSSLEDVVVIVGLIAVQFMYAGTAILLSYFLKLGLLSFHLIVFSNFATFLVLFPLALTFERTKWPTRIEAKLVVQLFFLSFGGVTAYQNLFMKGVELTSPSIATAMPNLAPGLVFLVAWVFRLEKVKLGCLYSKAKIAGTLLCVFGAVVMSLMQSGGGGGDYDYPTNWFDEKKILGSLYLIASVVVLSINIVLQAIALTHLPAPISLCAAISLLGAVITVLVQLMQDHNHLPDWPSATMKEIIVYSILTGGLGGMCVSFNTWAMKRRGPVMVSIFNPLAAVISAVFSVVSLGEDIAIESFGGMVVMFIGLYLVLWAKRKEGYVISIIDEENPLLT